MAMISSLCTGNLIHLNTIQLASINYQLYTSKKFYLGCMA